MVPAPCPATAPVPLPSYQRALAKRPPALHLDAVTVITRLHLLPLCRRAVTLARRQCPPPLPKGPGGAPQTYSEESLLLIALVRTLWRLGYQEMHDWLVAWPALAWAVLAAAIFVGLSGALEAVAGLVLIGTVFGITQAIILLALYSIIVIPL